MQVSLAPICLHGVGRSLSHEARAGQQQDPEQQWLFFSESGLDWMVILLWFTSTIGYFVFSYVSATRMGENPPVQLKYLFCALDI